MSISIQTYTTTDDRRKVVKTLNDESTINVTLIEPFDVLNPKFFLTTSNGLGFNYVYIPYFSRYYFVEGITVNKGGCTVVSCSVDVLTTYQSQFINNDFLIVRSESIGINYITDTQLPLYPYKDMKVIEFSDNDFNLNKATNTSYNFLLNVAGGGSNQNDA